MKELPKEFNYEKFLEEVNATQDWLLDGLLNMSEEDKLLYDIEFGEGAWQEDFGDA